MIDGLEHTLIEKLRDSNFEFYLTGVRFFQKSPIDANCNFEFFCAHSADAELFLSGLGFVDKTGSVERDNNTRKYFQLQIYGIYVLVHLVDSAQLRKIVQTNLYESAILKPTTEHWNAAYSMVKGVRQRAQLAVIDGLLEARRAAEELRLEENLSDAN